MSVGGTLHHIGLAQAVALEIVGIEECQRNNGHNSHLWLPSPSNLLFMMMMGFLILMFALGKRWYYALMLLPSKLSG